MFHTLFRKSALKKKSVFYMLFVFTCLILVVGCTQETQGSQLKKSYGSKEKNIKTVETVLKLEFTGPDKVFRQLAEKEGQEKFKEMYSYLSSKYDPYFTEPALESFIAEGAHLYQFININNKNYQMSIEEVKVKQNDGESGKNIYRFTAHVALESPNEKKTLYEVTGEAIFSEEGKIGRYQIMDKDQQLSNKLNNLSN